MDSPIDIRQIPESVRQIMERLDQGGFETWLVGGCVRDLCLGLIPKDYDLATNAHPEQVRQLFTHSFATGLQHGTVTVLWQDLAVEITTFRSESAYSDARRPDRVIFQNAIEADLSRRDFTMNSLAWRPDRGLLDLHGGLLDLQQGLLRTVGNPDERFGEDALRLLRAVRFAVTYDLTPDPDLVLAATRKAGLLDRLSRERIAGEIQRIMAAPYPQQLASFGGCGIMSGAAAILLRITADDVKLCANLSCLIQPDFGNDLRLPLLFLAAAAPGLTPDSLRRAMLPFFCASSGHALQHLLMHESRSSRRLAQSGEAMLYLFWLRLLLPLQQDLKLPVQRCLLRLLARRCHLENDGLARTAAAASRLLQICLGALPDASPESRLTFRLESVAGQSLTISGLALDGRQLYLAGWPPGPSMRHLLEKLLSRVINSPEINRPADLLALAWSLNRPSAGQLANDINLSCLSGSDI